MQWLKRCFGCWGVAEAGSPGPKRVIQATEGGRYTVLITCGGEQHEVQDLFSHRRRHYEVHVLFSAEEAGLVCDVLAIKEALDSQVDVTSLKLHSQRQLQADDVRRCLGGIGGSELSSSQIWHLWVPLQDSLDIRLERDQELAASLTLLHLASAMKSTPLIQLLLLADPQLAMRGDCFNRTPLHIAAAGGQSIAVQVLLVVAPAAASLCVADSQGNLPLHVAAQRGHAAVCELLVQAAPDLATAVAAANGAGNLALHLAAQGGHTAVCQMLLTAAPNAAMIAGLAGMLPLHFAARGGHAAATRVLMEATPAAALLSDAQGLIPLQLALEVPHLDAARCLLAAGPAFTVLGILSAAGPHALPLFADFVIARPPLSGEEWALVPAPCPGLGQALLAALAHSPEQARQLVLHLPPPDVQRLRTSALALHRVEICHDLSVPTAIIWRILSGSCVE